MGNKRTAFLSDQFYHVYHHGNGNDNIFIEEKNYFFFLDRYTKYIHPIADTFAYCLMPNHFHLLIKIKSEAELMHAIKTHKNNAQYSPESFIVKRFADFLNAYVKAFNKLYDRKGSLFMESIKRKHVQDEHYFTQLIKYIHQNPIHHGFSSKVEDWPYSSYQSILSEKPSHLQRKAVLEWFSEKEHFIKKHKEPANIGSDFF